MRSSYPTLLTLLAALGSALLVATGCSKQEAAPEPVRAVRVMTVASDSAGGSAEFAAEVKARTESRLSFRIGGKIAQRKVNLGDSVKAGQVLAQLDPQDMKLSQDAARAALAAAQVNFDQASADMKRFRELKEQGFISAAELERRETTLKAAQAGLDQARAQAIMQGNQAAYSTLVADAPGVITAVEGEPGMVVSAGAWVVRLAHDGPRDVVFAVPEDKVGLVKALAAQPGAFKVRLWGDKGAPLAARIREIGASADPTTRTFSVKADLAATDAVRLGQTATVLMELPRTAGVTKLPLSALKEEQGRTMVWLVDRDSMTVKLQSVEVAGADGNEVVISAGLVAGQTVVTAGVHVLSPGQKVKFYAGPGTAAPPASQTPAVAAVASK